ncbi:MAG: hypothetical protein GX444_06990 [Myxococcales bacterium]|nr:hypothetical protein [Myxococcales bacterium]
MSAMHLKPFLLFLTSMFVLMSLFAAACVDQNNDDHNDGNDDDNDDNGDDNDDNDDNDNDVDDDNNDNDDDDNDDDDNDNDNDDNDDTVVDSLGIELIDGGCSYSQTHLALLPGGAAAVATIRGAMPVVYRCFPDGKTAAIAIDETARGPSPAMAADAAGHLHVVFLDVRHGQVRYATDASGEWVTEPIRNDDTLSHYTPDLALDAEGFIHACFVSNRQLYYAQNTTGAWEVEWIEPADNLWGADPVLALDRQGKAHLAYYRRNESVDSYHYVTNAGGNWQMEKILDDPSYSVEPQMAIAVDSAGHPHVASANDNRRVIGYAVRGPQGWQTEVVYNDMESTNSLALLLDDQDKPHLIAGRNGSPKSQLYHITRPAASWEREMIATATAPEYEYGTDFYPSLARDASGQLHLSLMVEGTLRYATNPIGKDWRFVTLADFGMVDSNVALAVDGQRRRHLTYLREPVAEWRYAVRQGGSWHIETLLDSVGQSGIVDMATDADGFVHAVLGDHQNSKLWYASNKTGSWIIENILAGQTVEKGIYNHTEPAIAVDAAGAAHVVYSVGGHQLMYATNQTGDWETTLLDEIPGLDILEKVVAADSQGYLHIAYRLALPSYLYPYSITTVKYLTNETGDWETRQFDPSLTSGIDPDIAVSGDGGVFVSHLTGAGSLKLGSLIDGELSSEMVAAAGLEYSTVAVAGTGEPHLGATGSEHVWYFFRDGEMWQPISIDSGYLLDESVAAAVLGSTVYFGLAHSKAVWLASFPAGFTGEPRP